MASMLADACGPGKAAPRRVDEPNGSANFSQFQGAITRGFAVHQVTGIAPGLGYTMQQRRLAESAMTQTTYLRPRSPAIVRILPPRVAFIGHLKRLALVVDTWRQRHKSSMQCARVEPRVLSDLGISEAQRFIAVNKPFWEQ